LLLMDFFSFHMIEVTFLLFLPIVMVQDV